VSWVAAPEPVCTEAPGEPAIELEIAARTRSIGDFDVGRVLPAPARRMVGPFVFFDHMGPAELAPGRGLDVRPHPHIHLATVTYLFEGEILHRDSVGSEQVIRPGAINWMTAGRGIVHSERSPAEARPSGPHVHGLQLWVALPTASEDVAPSFAHHPAATLPELEDRGTRARVLAGTAYGIASPLEVASPLFYVEAELATGARIEVPREHEERAIYVVHGRVRCGDATIGARTMAVLRPTAPAVLEALEPTRLAMIGGAPLDGPRYIWWNFVSSSKERIEHAARDWREARFPKVPGDEVEFIPLAEEPRFPSGAR
jgi:redox-sensitive bicupin YhaK (pirin superfamily)